jgi:hypothetical protein
MVRRCMLRRYLTGVLEVAGERLKARAWSRAAMPDRAGFTGISSRAQ